MSDYGADTSLYEVLKGMRFTQSDANLPTLNGTNGFPFEAEAYPMNQGTLTNAFVKVAGSNLWTQMTLTSTQSRYEFKKSKNTLTALNNSYPEGTYQFQLYGVYDGVVGPSLNLSGVLYPAPPHINNFAALQTVNPNGYSVVRWDSFTSGTAGDFERITIEDPNGNQPLQSPNMDKQNALSGLATYALVGPGVLTTSQTYTVTLDFLKNVMVDRTSYPGALGAAAYFAETRLSLLTTTGVAPDVAVLEANKGTRWLQTNSGAVFPNPSGAFVFEASVLANQPNLVSSGSVIFPANTNAPSQAMPLQPDLITLAFSNTASSAVALEGSYPGGNYVLDFNTAHDGTKAITLSLSSVTNAPPAPHVSNFDSLQTLNAAQSFTVSWDKWAGGAEDFIQLQIADATGNLVYSTPELGQPKALNAGATNAVIGGLTLVPGKAYRATLLFKRVAFLDTATYPAVLSLADYYSQTQFAIITVPSDVATYSVMKAQLFRQTNSGSPVALAANGHVFSSQVTGALSNSVSSAFVTTPIGSGNSLNSQPPGSGLWTFSETQSDQMSLDSAFPYGNYTFQISCAHDGLKNLVLALPPASYPAAPQLTNYDAAQAIDSRAGFMFSWNSFGAGALNGFIQLVISDSSGNTVFETPGYGMPGALPGTATAVTIRAGTLASGQSYQGKLLFEALETVDTTTYPGATGVSGLASETVFTLATKAAGKPPLLSITVSGSNPVARITTTAVPQQKYRLDGCGSLPPIWVPLATNTATASSLVFVDPIPSGQLQFFYRVVALP